MAYSRWDWIQAIPIALIWRYIAWQLLTAAAQAHAALSNHGGRQLFTGHVEGTPRDRQAIDDERG
jgi:hypothetical protein